MKNTAVTRFCFIFTLVFAGEMIFSLPFHTTRFFRPTFLEVFGFSNTQLGDAFAFYGVTAMLSYFLGGPVADRFSPRGLMALSLATTAIGGLYLATIPEFSGTAAIYGLWGVTTIFLFWAALIRATREWGGDSTQGLAFGLLDGGRGVVAAATAVAAVVVFGGFLPDDVASATTQERLDGFRTVILFYTGATFVAALLAWLFIPALVPPVSVRQTTLFVSMQQVMRRPVAWAHALVIVCAYCGYKALDNYSLYAAQVMGMNEVDAASFSAYAAYLRPIGCIAAGLIADRVGAGKTTAVSFVVLAVIFGQLAFAAPSTSWMGLIVANLLVTYLAVYAFRGLYYALLEETRVPVHLTGATVGFVAFLGYTPDVFFGSVTGRILDAAPGLEGHQHFFLFMAAVSTIGLFAVSAILVMGRRANNTAAAAPKSS